MSIILFVLLFIISFYSFIFQNSFNFNNIIITQLSIVILATFIHFYKSINRKHITHSHIFIIGFIIVHFQYFLDLLLNNITIEYNLSINKDLIKSISISVFFYLSFLIGYNTYKSSNKNQTNKTYFVIYSKYLFTLSLFVLICLYYIFIDKRYLMGGYGKYEQDFTSSQIAKFINSFVIANLVAVSINKKNFFDSFISFLKYNYIIIVLSAMFLFGCLLCGDRGPIIYTFMTFFVCYIYTSRNSIKFKHVIPIFTIGAFLISIMGIYRGLDENNKIKNSLLSIHNNNNNNSFSPFTNELAGSVKTVEIAVHNIPNKYTYFYGTTQLNELLLLIPGGRWLYVKMFNSDENYYLSSSELFTYIAGTDYGVGTSCVADEFANFGIIGIILKSFLLGIFLNFLENIVYKNNYTYNSFLIILTFAYFSQCIYISRSTLLTPISGVVYSYIIFRFFCKIR